MRGKGVGPGQFFLVYVGAANFRNSWLLLQDKQKSVRTHSFLPHPPFFPASPTPLFEPQRSAFYPPCRAAVIGLVLVKELVLIDMFANIPVSDLSMRPIPQLRADTAMYDLLKLFQTGRTHMVLLTLPPAGAKLLAAQAAGSATNRADLAVNIEPHTIKRAAEEVCQMLCLILRCVNVLLLSGHVISLFSTASSRLVCRRNAPTTPSPCLHCMKPLCL